MWYPLLFGHGRSTGYEHPAAFALRMIDIVQRKYSDIF